jgi:monoamine oxidase
MGKAMLKRREFLYFAGSGVVLSVLRSEAVRGQGLGTDYDVVVVGAGVAGLAAAERLLALGGDIKVLVLEAQDRIGGRVHSVDLENVSRDAELGAMYLLDDVAADWSAIADFGLTLDTLEDGKKTLYPGMGALVDAMASSSSGQVQLNSEVKEIFWREGLVGVSYANRGLSSAVTARRLVISLPSGVLRDSPPKMTPPLSAAKLLALKNMESERALTVAMLFPKESAALRDGMQQWSAHTASSRFRATRDAEGALLLEAQFLGARAEPLVGQPDAVLGALALRGFADALEAELKVADAIWMASHDWLADPFARGAKTLAATTADHLTLAENMGNTVFFAGEATADPLEVGTVHGAFASGLRAAREVASSLDIALEDEDPNSPVILDLF